MNPASDMELKVTAPMKGESEALLRDNDQKKSANESKPRHHVEIVKPQNKFDYFVSWVRGITPDSVVNRGSQFNFGFKASADIMSVLSSVRKGSASPARLVASLITLFTELLGVAYKEKGVLEEKQEEYKRMSLPGYIVEKTKEAFNPKEHIVETVGLATIGNGIFTTISGFNQSVSKRISWEIFQGIMTTVAGIIMNYMPDRERAWQLSTAVFWTRAPVAGKQAYNAYFTGVPEKGIAKGDWQQGAKWLLNQTSNLFGVFYGGVRKLPDGTIVRIGKDEDDLTPQQILELKETSSRHHKSKHKNATHESDYEVNSSEPPVNKVTAIAESKRAMPDRVEVNRLVLPQC